MSHIIVVGDLHGDFAKLNRLICRRRPEFVLQVGDFGFWPFGQDAPHLHLKPQGAKIHWIDGNHEEHEELLETGGRLPGVDKVVFQPRGSVLQLPDGRNVLFCGGAKSIDHAVRMSGFNWFPDLEMLNEDDLYSFPDPNKVNIDIVVSHTAPCEFDVKGFPEHLWPDWWDHEPDPSRNILSVVYERYRPARWFFGHFHRFQEGECRGCKWTALAAAQEGGRWWIPLDPPDEIRLSKRAIEKMVARDRDQKKLERSEVSQEQLNRQNAFFSNLDVKKAKIVSRRFRPIKDS